MQLFYRLAADVIVLIHFAYVAFVILGLVAILAGWMLRWQWTRNTLFRVLHLLAITIVVVQAICGVPCPLTVWEQSLRSLAGEVTYQGAFLANCMHETLFYDADPWVFTLSYSIFGTVVLLTFWLDPPRFLRKNSHRRDAETQRLPGRP
jgi:hypothetical protein